MRIWWQISVLALLLCCFALSKTESPADLKTRADNAHGGEEAKLCIEYAHAELEYANDLFTKGDVDAGTICRN